MTKGQEERLLRETGEMHALVVGINGGGMVHEQKEMWNAIDRLRKDVKTDLVTKEFCKQHITSKRFSIMAFIAALAALAGILGVTLL